MYINRLMFQDEKIWGTREHEIRTDAAAIWPSRGSIGRGVYIRLGCCRWASSVQQRRCILSSCTMGLQTQYTIRHDIKTL